MSTYRYLTTDLVTGTIRADTVPLHVTSFSRTLGGIGQPGRLSGSLDLGALPSQSNLLTALEPRRTLLWVLQDGYPVWAGVLWDWPVQSVASNVLQIEADELGSLFLRREIRTLLQYPSTDLYDVIRGLINYATGKTGGAVAQLVHTTNTAGVTASPTPTFPATNTKVGTAADQFATQNSIEYAWDPGLSGSNNLSITLRIGNAATMGRPYSQTNIQMRYGRGGNLVDYVWPRMGSTGANSVVATAPAAGGITWTSNPATHGLDSADLAAGYPLLENSVYYSGSTITAQSQIDAYADAQLARVAKSPTIGKAILAGGQQLTVQQIQLGDHGELIATSPMHPAQPDGTPGLITDARIIGWTVHPPGPNQAESTELFLGGVAT